ncbi:hypothetical protein [Pseudoalteromonas xiamenensis]|uniref:Solute-binding protein family 3/N-terminal domain-containing protein n=1 Tax=Pseudoalteromonas xiamenensis TaxID=882626 RepID=A0A975DIB5_9GAMM|nr:hypothetical protein [Pseudoalteromonas xiamenensis]QTH72388.1 hypothetical protein J5O05_05965 [Pseudoalteromonas xiamenensis]
MFRLILLLLFAAQSHAAEKSTFLFNRPADNPQSRYITELVSLAYRNLGIDVKIVDFNHRSALVAANEGELDGQLARIEQVGDIYPNLIRVPFSLYAFNLQALKHCKKCALNDLKSLVITEGYPVMENYLQHHPFSGNLVRVKKISTQLNLLSQQKVDAALVIDFHLPDSFMEQHLPDWSRDNIALVQTYHFVHVKHIALLPQLQAQFQQFADNGTMKMLREKYDLEDKDLK